MERQLLDHTCVPPWSLLLVFNYPFSQTGPFSFLSLDPNLGTVATKVDLRQHLQRF